MTSIYLETYGFSSNQADGEMILGLLKKHYKIVDSPPSFIFFHKLFNKFNYNFCSSLINL